MGEEVEVRQGEWARLVSVHEVGDLVAPSLSCVNAHSFLNRWTTSMFLPAFSDIMLFWPLLPILRLDFWCTCFSNIYIKNTWEAGISVLRWSLLICWYIWSWTWVIGSRFNNTYNSQNTLVENWVRLFHRKMRVMYFVYLMWLLDEFDKNAKTLAVLSKTITIKNRI